MSSSSRSSPPKPMNPTPITSSIPNYSTASTTRLQSLYSDLSRQRASNPAAFQANVDWWRRTLEQLTENGKQEGSKDTLILHAKPSLAETLRVERVGKPLGLAVVVTELRHTKQLVPLDEFTRSTRPIDDPGSLPYRIASYVVTKPLWWALEQMNIVDSSDGVGTMSETSLWRKVQGPHVVMKNVNNAADLVEAYLDKVAGTSAANSLYTYDSFAKEVCQSGAGISLSESDVKVLVRFLERDRNVLVTRKDIIKVINTAASESQRTITSVDEGILELKTAIASLESQVEELQKRISYRSEKIKEYLREKQQDLALSHLRARKQHEVQLKKRLGSLEILQDTLIKVENAAQDIEIMKQYESSTATLRTLLSHPSLQREKVEETLEALAEVNAEQREIDDMIRMGVDVALDGDVAGIDESEVAMELEELVNDVKRAQEEKDEIARLERTKQRLPDAPKDDGTTDLEDELEKLTLQGATKELRMEALP